MNSDTSTPKPVHRTLELNASAARAWRALTDPQQLEAWFSDRVEGLEAGGETEGWFVWDKHGRYAISAQTVEKERRLVWRWARKPETPLAGGYNTTVEWTLSPHDDGGTTLHLVEHGFRTEADRQDNVKGWAHELGELVDHLAGFTARAD